MRVLTFTVPDRCDGKKMLAFLRGEAGLSHRLVNSLKREENGIMLNGARARTIDLIRAGDTVELNIPERPGASEGLDIPLDVIYRDADVMVINKPAGLAMHPTHNHQGDTLENAVYSYLEREGVQGEFHAVGRLDKCTSGAVLIALNRFSARALSGHFTKTYLAVAGGVFEGSGTIDAPIIRPYPNKTLRACGEGGERAVTHWTALGNDGRSTLLRVTLETGRTHQIRVHFAHVGAPLAGDGMYGSTDGRIARAALHCADVAFTQPFTGEKLEFSAPLPEDMRKLISEIV